MKYLAVLILGFNIWNLQGYQQALDLNASHVAVVFLCKQVNGPHITCPPIPNLSQYKNVTVALKPHIYATTFSWQGAIEFKTQAEWDIWWREYDAVILAAAKANPDILVIGDELNKATAQQAHWRSLIKKLRQTFKGEIIYATNWDLLDIGWWDAVDYIGVDAYFPLEPKDAQGNRLNNPRVKDLVEAWQPNLIQLEKLSAKYHKSILFTEIGYQSRQHSYWRPWQTDPAILSYKDQAKAYRTAYRALQGKSWFKGFWWWDLGQDDWNLGFTPLNKPAGGIILGLDK